MPTIEEMERELLENGYTYDYGKVLRYSTEIETLEKDGLIMLCDSVNDADVIKAVYAHYLQQQRSAKMEAFLREIVNHGDGLIIDYWIGRAKELLAEKETI